MNYWAFRITTNNREYIYNEVCQGRLRQGWGYDKNQDLRLGNEVYDSAKRNLPIFNKVKKGDLLLVPHVEAWDEVMIVEATEDFDKGYMFSIDSGIDDFGHIFPVKIRKTFSRNNGYVDGIIRETLKCRSRFWNINRCEGAIRKILEAPDTELRAKHTFEERFRNRVEEVFKEKEFAQNLYEELNRDAQAYEWEYILSEGFKRLFPDNYTIETTSNRVEKKHGADLIIKMPGIMNLVYVIAIQVKDYKDSVDKGVIDQICKADDYFDLNNGEVLVDKYVILIKAEAEINKDLISYANSKGVKLLFGEDVKDLLAKMARGFIGEGAFTDL